jgi:hypothetical protein
MKKKVAAGALLVLFDAVLLPSCWASVGTPMLGHEHCRYTPSVEECQGAASRLITEHCLRDCIIDQCRKAVPNCNAKAVAECARRSSEHVDGKTGGFVPLGPQTCLLPGNEVNWCQLDQSPDCQAYSMVHELAHMCGWHDGEAGFGVPGEGGSFLCL